VVGLVQAKDPQTVAKFDWAILCERAIVENQANIVSLVCIVENVALTEPPKELTADGKQLGVPFRMYLVQQWSRSKAGTAEAVPGRILCKDAKGNQFALVDFSADLSNTPRVRIMSQLGGFPYAGPGTYRFTIQAKRGKGWRVVGETEFNVLLIDSKITPITVTKH
jgi:hypothetical protein